MIHDLCEMHACNVRVPKGWEIHNKRSATSQETGYGESTIAPPSPQPPRQRPAGREHFQPPLRLVGA